MKFKNKFLCVFFSVLITFNLLSFSVNSASLEELKDHEIKYMLYDLNSGKTLLNHRTDEKIAIASVTKLMTALLTYEKIKSGDIDMDTTYTYSQDELDLYLRGSDANIKRGAVLTVDELLHLLLIRSANSSALALSKVVKSSEGEFVKLMNEKAKSLNMTKTTFINSHGLPEKKDEQNTSTIEDLNKMVVYILNNFPEILEITKLKEYKIPRYDVYVKTTNPLLGFNTVDGLKTGMTTKAGKCLISTATEPSKGIDEKRRIIAYVFGAKDDKERTNSSILLIKHGLDKYVYKRVLDGTEEYKIDLDPINYEKGELKLKPEGFIDELLESEKTYKLVIKYDEPDGKDIKIGEKMGTITLTKDGKTITKRDIVSSEEVKKSGFLKRFWKQIKSKF